MAKLVIEKMDPAHWPEVVFIYREGISGGNATFETEIPDWETWDAKYLVHSRLVASLDGKISGWAALSPVSTRSVYRGVAEVSVYVAEESQDQGIGRALLAGLITNAERHDIWTLQAGIFPENTASLHLHRSLGFREVGRREKIGQLRGKWRDVILLERRSQLAGG
jgi:phosphinothricin acetyltransferase